jgi:hypothetical protein
MTLFDYFSGAGAIERTKARLSLLRESARRVRENTKAVQSAQKQRMSRALADDCEKQITERKKLAGEIERVQAKVA